MCAGTPRPLHKLSLVCVFKNSPGMQYSVCLVKKKPYLWKDSDIRQTVNVTVARTSIQSVTTGNFRLAYFRLAQ